MARLKIWNGSAWEYADTQGPAGPPGTTDYNDLINKPTIPAVHNIAQYTIPRRTGAGSGPTDSYMEYSSLAVADTIARRSSAGILRGADPVDATDLVNKQSILNLVYPIGAIYMSVVNTSPATLFGGTWAVWGTGRVPVGVDAGQTEFDTVEETGGAKTHRHTFKIGLPHYYGASIGDNLNGGGAYKDSISAFAGNTAQAPLTVGVNNNLTTALTARAVTLNISEGDTAVSSNLQPYITCYMWKRTA